MQKGMPTEYMLMMIGAALITLHGLLWFGGSGDLVYGYCYLMHHFYDFVLPAWEIKANILAMLKSAAIHAKNVSFFDFCRILNATAYPFVILYILFSLWVIRRVKSSKRYRFNRQFTLTELAKVLVKRSPGVAHILSRYNEFPDQLLNHTDEESASPLSPQEFAEKNQLITNTTRLFRKRRAQKIFRQQINFSSCKNGKLYFKPYEAALAAVFYRVREHNDRDFAIHILDTLNISCLETLDAFPDFSRVMDDIKQVMIATQSSSESDKITFSAWVKGYRSTRTCLYALFDDDLSLPPAQFRWLKGLDRPLWMALSSAGRGKKFVEGAGIIAYSQTETWLKKEAQKTQAFRALAATVRSAANGLERELIASGDVISPEFPQPKGQTLFHDVLAKRLILQPDPPASPEATSVEAQKEEGEKQQLAAIKPSPSPSLNWNNF